MINLNNDYWKNKKENYENENNFININTNEGKRTRTIIGIILISAVAIVGLIDILVQNNKEERIKKINEEITKYNQKILQKNYEQKTNIKENEKQYSKENEEKINIYEKFEGKFLSYKEKNNEIFAEIWRWDKAREETIKTIGNNIQDLEYKIKHDNNFTFICKTKRKFYLEDCEIY